MTVWISIHHGSNYSTRFIHHKYTIVVITGLQEFGMKFETRKLNLFTNFIFVLQYGVKSHKWAMTIDAGTDNDEKATSAV